MLNNEHVGAASHVIPIFRKEAKRYFASPMGTRGQLYPAMVGRTHSSARDPLVALLP